MQEKKCVFLLIKIVSKTLLQLELSPLRQLPSQAALTSPSWLRHNPDGRHLFFSGRFNNPESKAYMKLVKAELDAKGVDTFMVQGAPGERYGPKTQYGLYYAKAMLAFCSEEYGARTGVGYETYMEVKYAHEQHIPIIPIKLCEPYPPEPSDEKGRIQNRNVFSNLDLHMRLRQKVTLLV